jgi:hypothetical protein
MSPSREVDRTPPIVCAGLGQVLGAGFGTVVGLLIAGDTLAMDGTSFTTRPVAVTGFPDPKSVGHVTAMLMIAGLDSPTAERVVDHL